MEEELISSDKLGEKYISSKFRPAALKASISLLPSTIKRALSLL